MRGMWYALAAYVIWGCFPLFFHLLAGIDALEVLSYRVVFAFLLAFVLLVMMKQLGGFGRLLRNRTALLWSLLASVLISINWYAFIWAVSQQRVLESSLGYFITPLVSLLIGRLVLKEQINSWQWSAGLVAAMAILFELIAMGGIPWVSLALAFSFGSYGLVRKLQPIESLLGLGLETLWVLPIASLVIGNSLIDGSDGHSLGQYSLLLASGLITAVPLLLFASSVRRINLVVAGFIMYINPMMQFVIAVWVLNEAVPMQRYVTFCLVWVAMALFIIGLMTKAKQLKRQKMIQLAESIPIAPSV
ncbi:EamA family transporter RarD [Reinekea sp.]|uniref:EamA family transporter RarD n=1 Tax=Reinekea sp. TaxID=1970455 RepID=UPI002A834ACF|nr:EamA family transporter RarD [Reinekea sp.]